MAEETTQEEPIDLDPDETVQAESTAVDEDEFDRLRRKSTLASSVYDDMELEDEGERSSLRSRLTPPQIVILLILLVIDICAVSALIYWVFFL